MQLLYAGLGDASIARQLDVGHRTVQRRIQRLMDHLGANGRVALGARAQELGLLRSGGGSGGRRAVVTDDANVVGDHGAGRRFSQR
ncbi:LuxR C-terminal-related transcriptional regulator [Streptomyces toyocaensis]|uniref:LuxR C-terminal-related transcriptional regulator n=1 Tax=Streptomyces toyocaensis TaxID=55952 RepID=UPI00099D9B7C